MTNGNGQNEEKQKVKHCPLINEWCIEKRCALYSEMKRDMGGGLRQTFGMCAFNAVVLILSEISVKTQPQQPKIQLPDILKRG